MTYEELLKDTTQRQRELKLEGLYTGRIDGIDGPKTKTGWAIWQERVADAARVFGSFDTRTEGNLATLIPSLQRAAREWLRNRALPWAEKNGLTLKIISGTRSYAEQNALYAKRPKVTNAAGGYSNHNFGIAFDIGLFKGGEYLTKDTQYDALYKACGVPGGCLWGGSWSFHDAPHYQLARWGSTTAAVRAALK